MGKVFDDMSWDDRKAFERLLLDFANVSAVCPVNDKSQGEDRFYNDCAGCHEALDNIHDRVDEIVQYEIMRACGYA